MRMTEVRFAWMAALASGVLATLTWAAAPRMTAPPPKAPPARIIFDTDMGNDIDDAMALAMLHAWTTRRDCDLLAVTITKSNEMAGPFVDMVNTFYGRPDIPIAVVRKGATPNKDKYLPLAEVKDGENLRYPRDLKSSWDTPDPSALLRKLLAGSEDGSVILVQVGFFTNFARLLDAPADDISPLTGRELVAKKVKLLSVMAGSFQPIGGNARYREYNVVNDLPAAQKLAAEWPTPIVWSGFEIGIALTYPAESIVKDFGYAKHHPIAEAYCLYEPPPHNRPTWDLTSAMHAVLPDRGYFKLSPPGKVTVDAEGVTTFAAKANGRDRYLILDPAQALRVREAMVQLVSEPPALPAGRGQ